MVSLKAGQQLGPYRVDRLIAAGGFARVYAGRDPATGRSVALKVPATRYPDEATVEEFRREAHENRKLRHPYILPVIDMFVVGGVPVLVTPRGRATLADRLGKPLPLAKTLRYGRQMLSAIAHAHGRHVLHCDVKPENLVMLPGDKVALTDFGAARRGSRTVRGDGTGTPGYMAPEQAIGRPSSRSDVYSAGIVLAVSLFGPLRGDRLPCDHPRLRRLPRSLIDLLERAIDPVAPRRFRDAAEMLAALKRVERQVAYARDKREGS